MVQNTNSGHSLFARTFAEVPLLKSSGGCWAPGKVAQAFPGSLDLAADLCNLGSMASIRSRHICEARIVLSYRLALTEVFMGEWLNAKRYPFLGLATNKDLFSETGTS